MADWDAVGLAAGPVGMTILGGLMQRRDAAAQAAAIATARNSVLTQYLQKQAALGKEGRGYFDTRMGDYAPGAQDTALAGAQDARTATSTGAITAPTDGSEIAFSGSTPAVVRGEYAKRMLNAFNYATDRAKASGKLGGYGDTWLGNNIGIADTGRRIGTVNNFAAAESAMLPDQQDFAQIAATKRPSMWGPILSGVGQATTQMAARAAAGGAG